MEIKDFYLDALYQLYGLTGQYIEGYDIEAVEYGKLRKVTSSELDAIIIKSTELKAEYDNNEYLRLRAAEMPSAHAQLTMMYNDEVNNTKTWKDFIKAIIDKYPKP